MNQNYEKIGMIISIVGGFLLGLSALIMAILTKSQAIMLDGMFTLITLFMSFISLKIINLVNLPETKRRPFGFVALEPFLNLIRCTFVLVLLIVCLIVNIQSVLSGGRDIELDLATYYTFSCIIIYLLIIFFITKFNKKTDSSILNLEVKEWYIDTFLTVGIAISLGIVFVLYKLGFTDILPYIDPVIVIILVIASLPMPTKIFITELNRLLLVSPENLIQKNIENYIEPIVREYGLKTVDIYAIKIGRIYQIFIYTDLEDQNTCIDRMDTIRIEIRKELSKHYSKHYTDVIFSYIDC
ncbi:MAG: cation transporter [bacterium]|nr:cation transporter [bacterium]